MPALVRIVGPYAKVFMYVDDRVLGLRGLTEHCIGETRAWAATIAVAEMARLAAPPGELAGFGRRYDIGGIVGDRDYRVIRMSATDIDGAYNAFDIDTLIWDTTTDTPVSPAVFFEELANGGPTITALAKAARASLKDRRNGLNAPAPEPTLAGIGPIRLARSTMPGKSAGLNFRYPVFTPGRFAPVHLVVFMPWQEFSRYLSQRGRAIFGGAWKEREIYGD